MDQRADERHRDTIEAIRTLRALRVPVGPFLPCPL